MDGLIILNKYVGVSSNYCAQKIKSLLPVKSKVGHIGTLDVLACGVLPIAIGEATKLEQFLVDSMKQYKFTIQFGVRTSTADKEGEIIGSTTHIPTETEMQNVCKYFLGDIMQTPPIYSALKINGIAAYKLARQNKDIALVPRKITIFELKCENTNKDQATYIVNCSKGTYVRSLAEDIAFYLKSLGFVLNLSRLRVGSFRIENSVDLNTIINAGSICDLIIRKEDVLGDIPVHQIDDNEAMNIRNGKKVVLALRDITKIALKNKDNLVAIGSIVNTSFVSSRVFNL